MNIEILNLFGAYETVDERGNLGACVGLYSTRKLAEHATDGIGWYGGKGSVRPRHFIVIEQDIHNRKCFELVSSLSINVPFVDVNLVELEEKLRKNALAKLTDEDKRVLGLK